MDAANFIPSERMDQLQTLSIGKYARSGMSVAHFLRTGSDPIPLEPNPIAETFMIVVPTRPLPAHGGWLDGRRTELPFHAAGSVGYLDWRQAWVADLSQPFETLNFFVPLAAFHELTDSLGGQRIDHLSCPCTHQADVDEHALGLAAAALPLLTRPHEASALFADYLFGAALLHFAVRYGGLKIAERRRGGRLAGWQERRAKEMMLDELATDLSVDTIAAACGLSGRQFERAFSQTVGAPPHRWRLAQRVRRARELIDDTELPLAQIADACGFVDQSHLTRAFAAQNGVTPGAYRRLRKG